MTTLRLPSRRNGGIVSASQYLPAIAFALIAAIVLAAPMRAPDAGEMAVVFPPLTTESTAWALVRQAGGSLVSPTRFSNIVVAYAPDTGFQERLRSLGALFFLAATGLCAPTTSSS